MPTPPPVPPVRPLERLIPVVVIAGPTGIGKTALAVALAQQFPLEVISADSRQIYRQMSLGTAKPSAAERAAVPHHLIDVVEPDQTLTMSEYQVLANAAIRACWSRGNLPLLVGGTGQYITAVIEGWTAPAVPPNPAIRAELEAVVAAEGALALFERLRQFDPVAAAQMDPYNARRTIRAIEVCVVTGRPFSEQRTKNPPPYHLLQLGLTMPREDLYTRLDHRVDAMLAQGLLDEVRALAAQGYDWRLPAMTSLGYDQLGRYLRGDSSLEQAIQQIKHDTHLFVRRQYTWFRKHTQLTWLEQPSVAAVTELIRAWRSGST